MAKKDETKAETAECGECKGSGISRMTAKPCKACTAGQKWGQSPLTGLLVPRAQADKEREEWYASHEARTGENLRPPK